MVRAVFFEQYGGVDVLQVGEVPEQVVGPDSVVVRVAGAGLNPVDWKVREGKLVGRLQHLLPVVPCWDVAGTVEAVGPAVTELAPGDRVFGYARLDVVQHGTATELAVLPLRTLAKAPASIDLVTAAAVPLAGLTAYQLVVGALAARPGDVVLVHAAAGGVGQFAVQLAVAAGARVLGTCSAGNDEHLRSLGAEPVRYGDGLADRVRALAPGGVDVVVDLVGGDALAVSDTVLAPSARIGSVTDAEAVLSRGGHYVFVRPSTEDLDELARRIDGGELRVDVAATFPLERAAEAFALLEGGHVRGKVVLTT